MTKFILLVVVIVYIAGFVGTLMFHAVERQMVMPDLALLRSALWPIYWTTGHPQGVPLTYDSSDEDQGG